MRVYRMAERNIGVESLYDRVHARCAAYRVEAAPDFVVRVRPGDIDRERRLSAGEDPSAPGFDDAYLEELAVYRQIAERMPAYDVFLCHGSAVAVDGWGYLFAAKSGVGKSTHARLWRELLGERLVYVNDDKPLVGVTSAAVMVYGTPYDGKHHRSSNIGVPLRAVCFLQRGKENSIRAIDGREAFPRLLQQIYRPRDRDALSRTVGLLHTLTERVGLYELTCNRELEAAQMAFKAMAPSGEDGYGAG